MADIPPVRSRRPQGEKTRQKLLEATLELLEASSFEDIRIMDITRRAGTATGSFHYHFRDKDELFAALADHLAENRRSAIAQGLEGRDWTGVPLLERATAFFEGVARLYRGQAGFIRARILRTYAGRGGWYMGSEGEAFEEPMRLLDRFFLDAPEEIVHPDPARAVAFAVQIHLQAMADTMVFPDTRRRSLRALEDAELVRELAHSLTAYLVHPRPDSVPH